MSSIARLRGARWGLIVPLALLLLGVFVGGVHHHVGASSERSCAVCAMSHAPAIASIVALPSPAPASWSERLHAPRTLVHAFQAPGEHRGRAPPIA